MARDHHYFVYVLASAPNGTIYIGMTDDLQDRMAQHRSGRGSVFTRRYGVTRLVWYEEHQYVGEAIRREKLLKKRSRNAKIGLIEEQNARWDDLSAAMLIPSL